MSFIGDLMGDQQLRQDVQGFIHRYEQGSPAEGYSDQEVPQRYQQVAPQLSQGTFVSVAERALGRLPPQQRSELASIAATAAKQLRGGAPAPGTSR